ncbi:MAG: hypothetical protein JSR82_22715 [Verrucomicrobia bacterium]|nr:hypothetical protein [Verrucomicrobiota bacterium]
MKSPLRALLSSAIDYAGLFPPAALALEPALRNYRSYLDAPEAWMLGGFVLPVAQFDRAEDLLGAFDGEHRLRISALGAKSADAAEFATEIVRVAAGLQTMRARHADRVAITQLEIALPPRADDALLHQLIAALATVDFDTLPVFCEAASAAEIGPLLTLLGQHRREFAARPLGFKLRTGGVVAAAFPSVEEVAKTLVEAAAQDLPLKFTAGLHHPIRAHHDSVQTKMHGFLNMLGAAILARTGASLDQVKAVLAEESPAAFEFTEEALRIGDDSLSARDIATHRRWVTSLGSCSFDEPREDLAKLPGALG